MNMRDRVQQAYKGKSGSSDKDGGSGKAADESASRPRQAQRGADGPALVKTGPAAPLPGQPAPRGAKAALDRAEHKAERLVKAGEESGLSKAAKFLLLLGTEEASKVLKHLPPREIEAISKEILKVRSIDSIEANDILTEFGWLVRSQGYAIEGGPDTARKMLSAAFGEDRAQQLLMKAAPDTQRPFRFLSDFDARELGVILKDESPQVLAVIIPYLDPKQASAYLERLPEGPRIEVVKRIAHLEKVSPEIIRRIDEGLKDRIRKIGSVATEELDGKAALAGILRHVDPRLEEEVLGALEEESPELSASIRERLFTMDDILRVPDRQLQKALRDFVDRDLALLLKGRNEAFKAKILDNVSKNRRDLILDEYAILGAVRREDADAAAREFLAYLKAACEEGDIVLQGDDELVE
jgi:flagellar motor switch protein FliG